MEASALLTKPAKQDESFWKHHHEILKSSGMKRIDYCNQNNLNYDRFGHWISRWNRFKNNSSSLVSVRLKSSESLLKMKTLCTLDLKNGCCLKIHDSEELTIILERMR